jgi:putative ribosome biogenesis GTPase RsgA
VEVLPRATEFRRAEKQGRGHGREEVLLASNFHHMCIVCAAQPATNSTLLDRYLAAASRMGVSSSIIFNKQDLPEAKYFDKDMEDFERVGVKVFRTSCEPGKVQGIEQLRNHLATVGPGRGGKGGITIFVGQSGSGEWRTQASLRHGA